jgi:hypothetical protein
MQSRSHEGAIAIESTLPFGAGLFIPYAVHGTDVHIAQHDLEAYGSKRQEQERNKNNEQQESHRCSCLS